MKGNKMGSNLKLQITIGVILIIIGASFLLNDFIVERRDKTFSKMNLELSELLANANNEEINIDPNKKIEEQPEEQETDYEVYTGTLEIPKIGFNKGFYKKESPLNDVKINIKILNESSYPDEDKGNVIIIGHSGNYSNSYFGELYKLENNDEAIINYKNKIYTYKITNIYDENKDGTITIYRDTGKSTLTLITCTKDDETKQTVYILELTNIK